MKSESQRRPLSLTALAGPIVVLCSVAFLAVSLAQEAAPQGCKGDLKNADTMACIISNVISRAEGIPEEDRRKNVAFREDARRRYATGEEVFEAAVKHFKTDRKTLAELVERWRHVNCHHEAIPGYIKPDSVAGSRKKAGEAPYNRPLSSYDARQGALILCGAGEFPDHVFKTFVHLAEMKTQSDRFVMVFCDNPKQRAFRVLKSLVGDKVELVDCSAADALLKLSDGTKGRLKKCSGVWLDLTSPPSAEKYAALMVQELRQEGKVVAAAGSWASHMLSVPTTAESEWKGLQLAPHCRMHLVKDNSGKPSEVSSLEKGMVHWMVPGQTALILLNGRTATSHGSSSVRMVTVPLHGEAVSDVLNLTEIENEDRFAGASYSTEIRRLRFQPELQKPFKSEFTGPEKGTLILNGGAGVSEPTFRLFIEAAGGMDARIVCIPTAGDDDDEGSYSARKLAELGCKNLSILHTRDPLVADSDERISKMLDEANGVWIDGGRTYRVMEAYEGTQVQKKIHALLQRGGVVGGSSAGCQLASEFLVRGNPDTADEMEYPLFNRGLGLVTGVILDAHFRQRHREYEFGYLVLNHPELLGIGVDEGTSLVVKGDVGTVVGGNEVTFFDAMRPISTGGKAVVPTQTRLKDGSRFNLKTRQVIP
jgi:cyanophycinase